MFSVFKALPGLMAEHGVPPKGVLHVGGHQGEEADAYRACGFGSVVWVEPNPALAIEGHVIRKAVGPVAGKTAFYVTEDSQASSLLKPLRRSARKIEVDVVRLDDIDVPANVLVVDVQGAELDVLQSDDLERFDMVVVETCRSIRYRGQPKRAEVQAHMVEQGFRRVGAFPHKSKRIVDWVYVK